MVKVLFFAVLFICFVAAFGVILDDADVGREKRAVNRAKTLRKRKKSGQIVCSVSKFLVPSNACCQLNLNLIFGDQQDQKECNANKPVPSRTAAWINGYNLNSLMKTPNTINFNSSNSKGALFTPACIVSCLFKKKNLMTANNKVDYAELTKYLEKTQNTAWHETLAKIVNNAEKKVQDVPIEEVTKNDKICSVAPLLSLQYIWRAVPENCPTGPLSDEACTREKYKMNFCDTNGGKLSK